MNCCRRFLAGLQMTASNPINSPARLRIIPENQGTQCRSPCMLVGTDALGRGAAQHSSGASPPPPPNCLHSFGSWPVLNFSSSLSLSAAFWQTCEQWPIFRSCLLAYRSKRAFFFFGALCCLLRSRFCLVLKVNGTCLSSCREEELFKTLCEFQFNILLNRKVTNP